MSRKKSQQVNYDQPLVNYPKIISLQKELEFLYFMEKRLVELKQEKPDGEKLEFLKLINKEWQEMSNEEQEQYVNMIERHQKNYKQDRVQVLRDLLDDDDFDMEENEFTNETSINKNENDSEIKGQLFIMKKKLKNKKVSIIHVQKDYLDADQLDIKLAKAINYFKNLVKQEALQKKQIQGLDIKENTQAQDQTNNNKDHAISQETDQFNIKGSNSDDLKKKKNGKITQNIVIQDEEEGGNKNKYQEGKESHKESEKEIEDNKVTKISEEGEPVQQKPNNKNKGKKKGQKKSQKVSLNKQFADEQQPEERELIIKPQSKKNQQQKEENKLKFRIEYCGGCSSYVNNYNQTKIALSRVYPDADIIGEKIPNNTGCFEVKMMGENDKYWVTLWSKLNGEKRVSSKNADELINRIQKSL